MQQHGEVEHDREGEPGDVLPARRARAATCSTRGATATAISAAMRNHEVATRTSIAGDGADREGARAARARARLGRRATAVGHVHATRLSDAGAAAACRRRWAGLGVAHERARGADATALARRAALRRPSTASTCSGALSPSRAGDFMTCPLLYRFRTIDRLPGAASAGRRARHGRPQGARGPLRPAGRRADAGARGRDARARPGRAAGERARAGRRCSPAADGRADGLRGLARVVPRPCWSATSQLEDPRRLEPAERELLRRDPARLRAAAARLHRPARRRRRTGRSGWWTTRPGASPGSCFEAQGAVPDEVLRPRRLAHPRGGPRGAAARLPRQRARSCATPPTRPTCWPPSARSRRCGGRSGWREETGEWLPRPGRLCGWCEPPGDLPGVAAALPHRCPTQLDASGYGVTQATSTSTSPYAAAGWRPRSWKATSNARRPSRLDGVHPGPTAAVRLRRPGPAPAVPAVSALRDPGRQGAEVVEDSSSGPRGPHLTPRSTS